MRKKEIHSEYEVASIWALQLQDKARVRASRGRFSDEYLTRLFSEGKSIYSYGHHFELARHVEHNGKPAVLFNDTDRSPTTSGHQGSVRSALRTHLPNVPVFSVGENIKHFIDTDELFRRLRELEAMLKSAKLAKRWRRMKLSQAADIQKEGNRFAEFFGVAGRLSLPEDFEEQFKEAAKLEELFDRKRDARSEEKKRKEDAKLDALLAAGLSELHIWRSGGKAHPGLLCWGAPLFLRIDPDDPESVEPSRSTELGPVDMIRSLFLALRQYAADKRFFRRPETGKTWGYSDLGDSLPVEDISLPYRMKSDCRFSDDNKTITWVDVPVPIMAFTPEGTIWCDNFAKFHYSELVNLARDHKWLDPNWRSPTAAAKPTVRRVVRPDVVDAYTGPVVDEEPVSGE